MNSATTSTNVLLVDAVRSPFGKAGSLYAGTRADDIIVRCIRGLLERNPEIKLSDVDDVAIMGFDNRWFLTANWKSDHIDERNIKCDSTVFELGLCPESAYKAMIADAIENKNNDEFWQNQYSQDMWIHSIMQLWM